MANHSFYKIIGEIGSEDRLLTAIMAVLLVAVAGLLTGPLKGNANPLLWNVIDRLFGSVARKTYNVDRSPSSLKFRGTIFTVLYILTACAIGAGFHMLSRKFPLSGFTDPILLALVLTGGSVWFSLNKLYHALAEGSKLAPGSYLPIAVSTRSNLNTTDDYGITRIGIGFMTQSFDKALIAPLFWFLIGGVPLAYLYAGIAAARWALAKDGFAKGLGDIALWLERIFGIIPHFIAGLFMSLAALFTPGAQLNRSLPAYFGTEGRALYAEGGLPLNVVAWALKVSLGGPVEDLDGSVIKRTWVGPKDASAKVDKGQLRRAVYMSVMAYVLVVSAMIAGIVLHRLA